MLTKIQSIPQIYRNVNRWGEILTILSRYGLADGISRFDLDFPKNWFRDSSGEEAIARLSREQRIRLAIVELGPTFIKLGQILSTRPDVVGAALANELAELQANVEADPPDVVRKIVESELGVEIDEVFATFDDVAFASASIGQCHRASLISGEDVVVKVQHAGIEQTVDVDLDILAGLAQLAEKLPEFKNYRPRATAAEFQRQLRRELDFGREERNMQQFARDFANDTSIRIPFCYTDLSTSRLLTMEYVEGIKLSDTTALRAAGHDLEEVARRGAEIYLEMIFTHGTYHADPHPGNLLVCKGNVIGLLDFGMIGRIEESLQEEIEGLLMSIVNQDAQEMTLIIMRLGSTPVGLDEASLTNDLADFVSHYGSLSVGDFNLSGALTEMVEIIRRYHISLPSRIAMLLKVLIMLEGTARLVHPTFSLMEMIKPFRRKILKRRFSPARKMRKAQRIFRELEHLAETLPRRITEILQQVQSGKFDVHLDHRGLEPSVNRLVLGLLTSSLFLGSSLMLSQKVWPLLLGNVSVLGVLGCLVSFVMGLRLLRAIAKSGHLDRNE